MNERVEKMWARQGEHTMSLNKFVALVAAFTMLGLVGTALAAWATAVLNPTFYGRLATFIGVCLLTHAGMMIAFNSQKPHVSMAGFALVALPLGVLMAPVLALYTLASIFKIFLLTAIIVVVLGTIGALYPKSLEHWGIYLLVGLIGLIWSYVGIIVAAVFGVRIDFLMTTFSVLEWVALALFGFIVVYDLNRAMRVPRTLDNAIDCALAVYIDFLNMFLRLLRAGGQRKS